MFWPCMTCMVIYWSKIKYHIHIVNIFYPLTLMVYCTFSSAKVYWFPLIRIDGVDAWLPNIGQKPSRTISSVTWSRRNIGGRYPRVKIQARLNDRQVRAVGNSDQSLIKRIWILLFKIARVCEIAANNEQRW